MAKSCGIAFLMLISTVLQSHGANVQRAIAVIRGAGEFVNSSIRGTVVFSQNIELDAPVEVTLLLEGLPPGEHGFHVHQHGDARTKTTETLGKHFTPICVESMCETATGVEPCSESCPVPCDMTCRNDQIHGFPPSEKRQAGDMGNITVDALGRVETKLFLGQGKMSLSDPVRSVVGRSVVVHERADDGSQPFGNAGPAIAFGIIGIAAVANGDTNLAVAPSEPRNDQAVCVFQPIASGTKGVGMALFTFTHDYSTDASHMKLQALVSDLKFGEHSFHFHEYGDLSVGVESGLLGSVYSDDTINMKALNVTSAEGHTKYEQNAITPSPESVIRHIGRMLTIHSGPSLNDPTVATAVCGIAKFGATIPGFDDAEDENGPTSGARSFNVLHEIRIFVLAFFILSG